MSPDLLRRLLILYFVVVFVVIVFLSVTKQFGENIEPERKTTPNKDIYNEMEVTCSNRCYVSKNKSSVRYLDDILDAEKQPKTGKTIFFHETTCSETGIVAINSKQACAIESVARLHPDRDIFVLFASPVGLDHSKTPPKMYDKLQEFRNIHWRNVDLWRYSADTPIYNWMRSNQLFESEFLFEHISDIVRALTLFKYGGYHMDLDVIVQKNIDDLGEDFIPDDWEATVNGAVLHLNNFGIGREILERFFSELIEHFDGGILIANGPDILTRICEDICQTENRTRWNRERCRGLKLLPKEVFYPISWPNFEMYFDSHGVNETLELVEHSAAIHVWNDRSKNIWNKIGTNNAYQVIAQSKCPLVYSNSVYF